MYPKFLLTVFILLSIITAAQQTRSQNSSNITTTTREMPFIRLPLHKHFPQVQEVNMDSFATKLLHDRAEEYYVEVYIGTPGQLMKLQFHIGSSGSWVRCYPCVFGNSNCATKTFFKSPNSKSYFEMGCEEKPCLNLKQPWCEDYKCHYHVTYRNDAFSSVVLAYETIRFEEDDEALSLILGCSFNDSGYNMMDGSLGLSRGPLSFYTLLKHNYGVKMFSYCLLDRVKVGNDSSHIIFGEQSVSADTMYTPWIERYPDDEYYSVSLLGIKVNGETISNFHVAMTLDTGKKLSQLPEPMYQALSKKIHDTVDKLGWGQAVEVKGRFPCYKIFRRQIKESPSITFTFEGDAELLLRHYNIWEYLQDGQYACLAFEVSPDDGFFKIGNIQQQSIRIIIDQRNEDLIGFDPSGC